MLRRGLWLALLLCCASGLLVPSARPRSGEIVMKGRHVGGGPAISTKKKRRKPEVRQEVVRVAAAAKEAAKPKLKVPELGRQRQYDRHVALVEAGAAAWPVYVRRQSNVACADAEGDRSEGDGSSWLEVGAVSFVEGQLDSAAQAAWLHKRLILEHAVRLFPKLIPHASDLELGLCEPSEAAESEPVEPQAVVRPEARPAAASSCGFAGLEDPYAGHYFAESEQLGNEGKKMQADRQGLAATKAATAMEFSKSLGLRSG